ncbi:hypothetical protein A3K64_03280 [Candidatus Micrarchaeota archaeon RBG_16_36_9]|nr:MAG: hypothetical protein A3K64_03280 [Candidatus Micrarchaeota archaeon RBG_16_36_9]
MSIDKEVNFKDLAMIFAALLSDGSIQKNRIASFTNKDIELIKAFKNSYKSFFHLSEDKFKGNWNKSEFENKIMTIKIHSKEIVNFLLNFSKFKHNPTRNKGIKIYPVAHIPEMIFNGNKKLKYVFLKMYASCDGCIEVSIRYPRSAKKYDVIGNVVFACENPTLNLDLFNLLKSLAYTPIRDVKRVRLTRIKDIIKFENECGFIEGCKIFKSGHGAHFYNEEKNKILKLLVYLLKAGIPKNLSKVFRSHDNKNQIKKYLIFLLDEIKKGEKLPKIKFKQGKTTLNIEEKKWILSKKLFRKNIKSNKKYILPATKILKHFKKKFKKNIDVTTIYWYWTRFRK